MSIPAFAAAAAYKEWILFDKHRFWKYLKSLEKVKILEGNRNSSEEEIACYFESCFQKWSIYYNPSHSCSSYGTLGLIGNELRFFILVWG